MTKAPIVHYGPFSTYVGGLPVGRMLDALIAEKVDGYQRHDWRQFDHPCIKKMVYCENCRCTRGPLEDLSEDGMFCNHPHGFPEYSTDVDTAFELVERLGQGVTLFRNLWGNGVWHWHCHLGDSMDNNETSVEVESLAHAICLAALLFKLNGTET